MKNDRQLTFTQAELYFLARVADTPAGDRSAAAITLQTDPVEILIPSGIGGLVLREYAQVVDGTVILDPTVKGIANALGTAQLWVQLGLLSDDESVSFLLLQAPELSMTIAPAGLGVFEVAAVESRTALSDLTAELVARFVATSTAQAVELVLSDLESSTTAVLRKIDDAWLLVNRTSGADESAAVSDVEPGERLEGEAVGTRIASWLGEWMAIRPQPSV